MEVLTPLYIAGVDPDTKHPSVAMVQISTRKLVQVFFCQSPWTSVPLEIQRYAAHGVIEDQPQIFPGIRARDILRLAQSAGAVATWFPSHEWVMESRWKRGIKKEHYHEYLTSRELTPDEQVLLKGIGKVQLKEILDAVGIALWKVGRTP